MYRLLETIKIENNNIFNIEYHNLRLNKARKELFGLENSINLLDFIQIPQNMAGIIKCRVLYSQEIEKVEYESYKKRNIQSLKTVYCDDISYNYKFEDRTQLNELLKQKGNCDEILIIKHRRITDTSFTNIIFFDGKKWFTHASPLLKGTKREKLITESKVIPQEIYLGDLKFFKKAMLINAMLDMENGTEIKIENIY
ncbi:MAG: hypothetical protein A2086_04740 [Spirochaetes bacterium GWD1_27_9]|nr:MAG: hypothetical protein A2Z98_17635 [Spirochaetes bacterium GWB1_27_13]OHD25386.1 MAG: hypothetical protein A2Y34_10995 [Spirochaetes bacterium GWC1_27_15]OHD30295.1 MAG: hypothetical protein A2086_04740 [Spirochaetes bacterium GWD1_27_9]